MKFFSTFQNKRNNETEKKICIVRKQFWQHPCSANLAAHLPSPSCLDVVEGGCKSLHLSHLLGPWARHRFPSN